MDSKELMTEDPTQQPTQSPEVVLPSETPVPDRAVYDGDISDSILAKLSTYYNEHGDGEEYVIYRPDQYNYYLVFGSFDNGLFTNATIVHYHSQSSYNSNDCTVVVSTDSTIRPDLTGDTGYLYSSLPSYLPSRYISSKDYAVKKGNMVTTVMIVLLFLVVVIGIWCSKFRKRWL